MAIEHDPLSHRAATPSFRKKGFGAVKMDVQIRANSTTIRPLTLRDHDTGKIVMTRKRDM
jgi:hypothetical protein